jgi:phenylacetate-CoA ligase
MTVENNDNFSKFKELLQFVYENKHSDFYRIKFQKAGFNPLTDFSSINDIKKIPFLTKKELSSVNPHKLLFVNEKEIDFVRSTSGTTGKPLFIFTAGPDTESKSVINVNFGRFLLLFSPLGIAATYRHFKNSGYFMAIGDIHNLPASLQTASELKINTIYTTATMAIILKDYFPNYPKLNESLKYLYLAGEFITPHKKKFLQGLYPNLEIFLGYGTAETNQTAFQCQYLIKQKDQIYFHTKPNNQYIEIINPDTNQEVEMEEKGEIVLTNFGNLAMPAIRYKTGDLGSLKKNNCSCQLPGPLLQIWGRLNYDIVKAGGFELRTDMLEKPLFNLQEYLQRTFEGHIYENFIGTNPKIKLVLNLCLKHGVKESPELKTKIENEFLENWQISPMFNLKKAVAAGLFEVPQINFVESSHSAKEKKALILHQS